MQLPLVMASIDHVRMKRESSPAPETRPALHQVVSVAEGGAAAASYAYAAPMPMKCVFSPWREGTAQQRWRWRVARRDLQRFAYLGDREDQPISEISRDAKDPKADPAAPSWQTPIF